jgi:hypothetical protein
VVGVADHGLAEATAKRLGLPAPTTRQFEELTNESARDPLRSAALEAAARGPVALVVRRSSGPFQRQLATDVALASPNSIVVVLAQGPLQDSLLEGYPAQSVLVASPSETDDAVMWAEEITRVVMRTVECHGG